ncbi:hypothetical protein J6500_01720 [Bradyrhizobium sp. WSM 1704]|uniref:hypothetical protein n=1 Tax=Bradyrhizobium semiaridum TaxID=2821404 RepID=UPI001CE2E986|nr:hypothetical protein [Bradyrhizobium semiaridum]MCA6120627.1 hypothetical protein [Bradyrhizobium semiaridum]
MARISKWKRRIIENSPENGNQNPNLPLSSKYRIAKLKAVQQLNDKVAGHPPGSKKSGPADANAAGSR